MTDAPPVIAVDLPLEEAVQELTGFEVIAIEKHFDRDLAALGGFALLVGAVWAYGNRGGTCTWNAVKAMTVSQLSGVFPSAPNDFDPDEPESELGKG